MRLVARSTAIALGLAVVAIAAPAASARFNLEPSSSAPAPSTSAAAIVRPNPDQQSAQTSRVGPPILHRAAPSELGAINHQEATAAHASSYKPASSGVYSSAGLNGYVSSSSVPATVHVTTHSNPFQWGDAAIGAASGFALSLLVLGSALVISQRRGARVVSAEAVTS